jgi:hypothetical protein
MLMAMEPLKFEEPLELEKVLEVVEPLKVEEILAFPLVHKSFLLTFNLIVEESFGVQMEKLQSLLEF